MREDALSMPILDSAGFWMICGSGTVASHEIGVLTRAAAYPRRRRPHIRQCGDDDPQRRLSDVCNGAADVCDVRKATARYPSYAVKGNLDRDPLSGDLVDPQLDFGEVAGAERLANLVLVVDVVGHVSHARSSGHCRADLRGAHEQHVCSGGVQRARGSDGSSAQI